MPEPGHLTVTLAQGNTVNGVAVGSSGYVFPLICDVLAYESVEPYRATVLNQGEVDYQSVNPKLGVPWNMLEDVSGGAGGFFAGRGQYNDGKYGMCDNFDAEYLCQGPRQVNEYPGIPFGVTPVGYYKAGTTEIVWTDSEYYALYKRVQGTHFWTCIGGRTNYDAGATGLANTWASLSTAPVKCVAHLGTYLMVGFGDAAKWVYTADYTSTTAPPTWVAEPETGDDEYAHVAMNATIPNPSTGVSEQCIVFLGANGKLFKTTNLVAASAAALGGGATIGDATGDTANSIIMDGSNTIMFIGKDSGLYFVDSANNAGPVLAKKYPVLTTSASGGLAPRNFRHATMLGNGHIYWLVGDYTILEREPVNGTPTEFSLLKSGKKTPRMQLPLLAMCAGPDDSLYVATGHNNSSLLDLSTFPAGTQLVANTCTTGTTYLFKGFGKAHLGQWTWHGSLGSVTQLACLMWYAEEIQRLFVSLYTDSSDRAGFYFRYTQDNFGSFTDEDDVVRGTGTGGINAMDTLANGDALLIGFSRRFNSLAFDMGVGVNNNVSTLTVAYSTGAGTWSNVTDMLDGTKDATATFARDGVLQWDLPATATNWTLATYNGVEAYWVRITTNALLDNLSFTSILPGYSENLRQFVVVSGDPTQKKDQGPYDTSGSVKVHTGTSIFETGLFTDQRPLDNKAGRKFQAVTQNIAADPTLVVKVRTASDGDPSAGFLTMATYTSDELAEAGTNFSYNATNPPSFKSMRFRVEITPSSSTTAVQIQAALFRFVDAQPKKRVVTAVINAVGDGQASRQGVPQRRSLKKLITELEAWRDAVNPVATVVDEELGLSMDMTLADFQPKFSGKERLRSVEVTMIEAV